MISPTIFFNLVMGIIGSFQCLPMHMWQRKAGQWTPR